MDELTIAWIPDIVAIVNMTSAMLANVAPVRNFLFIGYAIAVRTTGRQRGGTGGLEDQILGPEEENRPDAAEARQPRPDGNLTSRRPVRDRFRDVPDRPHDVQLGDAKGRDPNRGHRDQESDRETREQ